MSEIQRVLESFPPKGLTSDSSQSNKEAELNSPTFSEIPDMFFDNILTEFKLSRLDIQALLYLYRQVWCLPNLYRKYGIGQLNNLKDLADVFGSDFNSLQNSLQKLESYQFISTIRLGQYFVRRFFTPEWDYYFSQNYDDFSD